jgi:hypothetical protein
MNQQTHSSSADLPSVIATDVNLRALLRDPKPSDAAWQDEAGRMVAMLAVGFSQADDAQAFSTMAVIGLAAGKGVKEAKKRTLNLARWSKSAPPNLESLEDADEQSAAIAAMSKVKAPWVGSYLSVALSSGAVDARVIPDLLRWLRRETSDWVTFAGGPYLATISNCPDSAHAHVVLKEGPKLLRITKAVQADRAAETLAILARAISDCSHRFAGDAKVSPQLLASGFAILEQKWQTLPVLLLQPAMLNAIAQLSDAMRALKKPVPTSVDTALLTTLFLISDSINRFGDAAVRQLQSLVPLWSLAYPDFQKQLKLTAVTMPALSRLTSTDVAPEVESDQRYQAEAAFASLLPAWEAFVSDLPDPDSAVSLTKMMHRAAGSVNVEMQGAVGEVVDYDPLSQHLADAGSAPPRQVRVVRAGVVARRQDGSVRTLVQMLVKAV